MLLPYSNCGNQLLRSQAQVIRKIHLCNNKKKQPYLFSSLSSSLLPLHSGRSTEANGRRECRVTHFRSRICDAARVEEVLTNKRRLSKGFAEVRKEQIDLI